MQTGTTRAFRGTAFEHNKLYLSGEGRSFVEIGYLMDVAFEFDARTVLDMDIDADGRMDLLVSEWSGTPRRERVHVLRNVWPGDNNWLGVRLQGAASISPIGARITLRSSQGHQDAVGLYRRILRRPALTHPPFWLGPRRGRSKPSKVQWPDGKVTTLSTPQINRYHELTP